ncbi:MAG: RidA family protein [Calditrichota bacterium]
MRRIIETKSAPAAIGPYSQAVEHEGRLLFTAGQLGLDPDTGAFVEGGVAAQAERALKNLNAILEAGHSSLARVLKVTIFLADMKDFAVVNEIYSRYFPKDPPARSAIQAAALPKGALVEIECIAQTL